MLRTWNVMLQLDNLKAPCAMDMRLSTNPAGRGSLMADLPTMRSNALRSSLAQQSAELEET